MVRLAFYIHLLSRLNSLLHSAILSTKFYIIEIRLALEFWLRNSYKFSFSRFFAHCSFSVQYSPLIRCHVDIFKTHALQILCLENFIHKISRRKILWNFPTRKRCCRLFTAAWYNPTIEIRTPFNNERGLCGSRFFYARIFAILVNIR